MNPLRDAETMRVTEQERLDRLKDSRERNRLGQFATPPVLSLDIAQFAWEKLRRRKGEFRFLDPAIGTGSFFSALLQTFPPKRIACATGIELDKAFAEAARTIWRPHGLEVVQADFTKQKAQTQYNVLLANPPYVRHHHLPAPEKQRLGELVYGATGRRLSGLSGLYCYFLLSAHAWLAEDGLAAWLVPSEFMDVNYGDEVKRYLASQVSLLRVHRFRPADVQFDDALVSSAVVVFEKRRPKPEHEAEFSLGGTLTKPEQCEAVSLEKLAATRKWTALPQSARNGKQGDAVTLGDLFTVRRGIATGSNGFFILAKSRLRELGIPLACVRPVLPSPRFLKQEIVAADADGWPAIDQKLALIDCDLGEEEIGRKWPRFAEYLADGTRKGIHEGYLTSRRSPWYSQEKRAPAPFLCTYMGRSLHRPFRFIWNKSRATAANVYLLLYPKDGIARAVVQNEEAVFRALQGIHPEDFLSEGRVYGGGLHKMEPAELMRLPADSIARVLGVRRRRQLSLF